MCKRRIKKYILHFMHVCIVDVSHEETEVHQMLSSLSGVLGTKQLDFTGFSERVRTYESYTYLPFAFYISTRYSIDWVLHPFAWNFEHIVNAVPLCAHRTTAFRPICGFSFRRRQFGIFVKNKYDDMEYTELHSQPRKDYCRMEIHRCKPFVNAIRYEW